MSKFTRAELAYLCSQQMGRLATVNERGEPQNTAVIFRYNAELDTVDIDGYDLELFRNIIRTGLASLLVDDVLPPGKMRSLEIRGQAQVLPEAGQPLRTITGSALIRLTPTRILFWDESSNPPIHSRRNVQG